MRCNQQVQGTAAVTVAGILGGLRLRAASAPPHAPHASPVAAAGASPVAASGGRERLSTALKSEVFLFHGAGSAVRAAAPAQPRQCRRPAVAWRERAAYVLRLRDLPARLVSMRARSHGPRGLSAARTFPSHARIRARRTRCPSRSDLATRLALAQNLGAASLLVSAAGVPPEHIFMTNSRGLIWRPLDTSLQGGTYRNEEQKAFARIGPPGFRGTALADVIAAVRPTVLVGAVGVSPGCFDASVWRALQLTSAPRAPSWRKCLPHASSAVRAPALPMLPL
jgi:hypothetical protein